MIEKNKMKILPMRKSRDNRGFTLLEILVAIVLLSIGLLAMASLTTGIMSGNLFSNQLTTATTLAQDKMEENRRLGYDGVAALTESYGSITGYTEYERVTTVASIDNPATGNPAGMYMVTVTVSWDSDDHSVALNTIVAE